MSSAYKVIHLEDYSGTRYSREQGALTVYGDREPQVLPEKARSHREVVLEREVDRLNRENAALVEQRARAPKVVPALQSKHQGEVADLQLKLAGAQREATVKARELDELQGMRQEQFQVTYLQLHQQWAHREAELLHLLQLKDEEEAKRWRMQCLSIEGEWDAREKDVEADHQRQMASLRSGLEQEWKNILDDAQTQHARREASLLEDIERLKRQHAREIDALNKELYSLKKNCEKTHHVPSPRRPERSGSPCERHQCYGTKSNYQASTFSSTKRSPGSPNWSPR